MVLDTYGVQADYPFEDDLVTGVFRHTDTGKWFALAMNITERKIREGDRRVDVVNLKIPPEIIESIVGVEVGIYPAYHMNKLHWITVALDDCDPDMLSWLLGISHELTRKRIARKSKSK